MCVYVGKCARMRLGDDSHKQKKSEGDDLGNHPLIMLHIHTRKTPPARVLRSIHWENVRSEFGVDVQVYLRLPL